MARGRVGEECGGEVSKLLSEHKERRMNMWFFFCISADATITLKCWGEQASSFGKAMAQKVVKSLCPTYWPITF